MSKYDKEPRLLHGGDYNPDQWLKEPNKLADDLIFMKQVKANAFSVGMFSWSSLEPTEGNFQFDWLDKIMDDIHSIGGYVLLATPSGARPAWMSEKYPQVLRVNKHHQHLLHGGRHNHCYSSPIYRTKVGIINRKLAERYKNHPALLMWHISNEYSGQCFCNYCQVAFREWLKGKYKTIQALNDAYWATFWSHTYNDFSQIEPPSPIGEEGLHALNLDWNHFVTHQTIDFYKHEIAPLREITPDIPITTNFMGEIPQAHPFAGLDYAKFAKEVDIISWDAYPPWHNDYETTEFLASKLAFLNDYFRTLKDKPFLILESTPSQVNWHPINKAKRPGMHMLSAVACLAHGADSVMYFQWRKSRGSTEKFHGAVVDHDNSPTNRVFKDVQAVGEMLEKVKEIKGTVTPATIAVMFDMENFWALGDAQGFNRNDKKYADTVHAYYKVFWDYNIPVDVVTKDKDLSKYAMVVIPMMYMMDENLINSIKSYVENGGIVVSTYLTGIVNETDLVYEGAFHPTLREIFGINILETDTLYPSDRNCIALTKEFKENNNEREEYEVLDYCALIEPNGAEILGRYTKDFYANAPAFTCNKYGKGKAYFIGARMNHKELKDFFINIEPFECAIKTPCGISVQVRVGDGCKYYFVMNFTEEEQTINLGFSAVDLITGEEVTNECVMKPYGVHILKHKN
jgi:beta-galactosidase